MPNKIANDRRFEVQLDPEQYEYLLTRCAQLELPRNTAIKIALAHAGLIPPISPTEMRSKYRSARRRRRLLDSLLLGQEAGAFTVGKDPNAETAANGA